MSYDITFCEGTNCQRKEQCHRYRELLRYRADKDKNKKPYISMCRPTDSNKCTLFLREKGDNYCANCVFYDVEYQCSRPGGLLYGIRISDAMAKAEHDCTKFQEAVYRATPAELLWLTMQEAGMEIDGGVAKQICDRFFQRMMNAGMLKKGGTDDEIETI